MCFFAGEHPVRITLFAIDQILLALDALAPVRVVEDRRLTGTMLQWTITRSVEAKVLRNTKVSPVFCGLKS